MPAWLTPVSRPSAAATVRITPAKIGIAPGLGEHNEEVLGSLGYDSAQIADLKSRKVI